MGRLDLDTRGVLLLTDDGDLAHRLMHPRWGVEKTYRACVRGVVQKATLDALSRGVELDDGPTAPAKVNLIESGRDRSALELTLTEGRKRQVKRMCEAVGHRVLELDRVCFGGLTTQGLQPGQRRDLDAAEVAALRQRVGLGTEA